MQRWLLLLLFAVFGTLLWCQQRPDIRPQINLQLTPPKAQQQDPLPAPAVPDRLEMTPEPLSESEYLRYYTRSGEQAVLILDQMQFRTDMAHHPQIDKRDRDWQMTVKSADGMNVATLQVDGWQKGNHAFSLDAVVFGRRIQASGTATITESDNRKVVGEFATETPSVTSTAVPPPLLDQPNIPVNAEGLPLAEGETPVPPRRLAPDGRQIQVVPGPIKGIFRMFFP